MIITNKIGISIGYGCDVIGFLILFLSGTFDSKYKLSLGVIENLKLEIKIQEKMIKDISKLTTQTITKDIITGVPIVGTGFTTSESLFKSKIELKRKKEELKEIEDHLKKKFKYYFTFSEYSSFVIRPDTPQRGV